MADANFTIGADAKAFTETLQKMGKDLDKLANGGTSKLARLGQAFNALSMGAEAIKAVGGSIVDAAKAIIQPAAAAERLSLSFEVMLGSETQALQFMDRLNAYAAETPFALDEISQAARLMLANTSMSADEVMTRLQQIGNLAAMTGKNMAEFSQVYAKAMNVGVTNEVAESFETMGVPIRAMIAELKGVSFEDVFDMISKREIGAAHLNAALELLTTSGGKFDGATQRLSQTFEGLYSTLEDNVNMALRTFGEQILPAIKPVLDTLIDALDAAMPTVEQLGIMFGEWLSDKVSNDLVPSLEDMILRLPELGVWLEYAMQKALDFADKIFAIPLAISSAIDGIKRFGQQVASYLNYDFDWEQAGRHADRVLRADEPEKKRDDELARLREQAEAIKEQAATRKQQRLEEAAARDEARAEEKEAKEEERRLKTEQARRDADAFEAEKRRKKEERKLITDNAKALEDYQKRREKWEHDREQKRYEKMSIPAQERELTRRGRDLGVEGQISPESIRARLEALATAGAKSNEQEIAALERLLEAWDKLADRKREYSKTRGETATQMRIDALEAAGQRRAAALLREKLTVAQRVEELQNQGATKRAAMEQATAESKIRQLAAVTQALQASRVEFVQGHQAAEGGGGVSLRVANNTLELSRKRNTLLKDVKDIVERISKNAGGSNSNIAVLA